MFGLVFRRQRLLKSLFDDVNMLCTQLSFTTLDQLTASVYTQSLISKLEVMSHVLRKYITKDLSNTNLRTKFTNKINCFNISGLLDVENNPLVGMLASLTYNESVFPPYQFAETVICYI